MAEKRSRYCTIQVDVDGLWVIGRLLGRDFSIRPDPVFDRGIDLLLDLLNEFDIKATFFIVARDLEADDSVKAFRRIIDAGHEIASHGMDHAYLSSVTEDERRREIALSKKAIEERLGIKVRGFKAAGFAINKDASEMLLGAGYEYDSSVLGNSLACLMELFSGISYPKWGMMRSPPSPYRSSGRDIFRRGEDGITEIPVTTMPFFRLPIHFSYASLGGRPYLGFIRAMLEKRKPNFVNYLFHPLDLLDHSSVRIDAKVYGLERDAASKVSMAKEMLGFLKDQYDVVGSDQIHRIAQGTF